MAKEMNREEDGFFAEATDQENVLLLCLFPFPWYLLKVEKCDQCCTMRRFKQCQSFRESSFLFQYISPLFYRIVRGERPKNILYNMLCATSEFAIFLAVSQTTRISNFTVPQISASLYFPLSTLG